jgi:uncharacterized membrane protein YphA (DoxX/SURF4 family)
LILLRTAIGWHFLYEAVGKIQSQPDDRDSWLSSAVSRVLPRPSEPEAPFTAEGYLRSSAGPLAKYFRELVPDADGLGKLDLEKLKASWARELEKFAAHYNFDDKQRAAAATALKDMEIRVEAEFRNPEFVDKITKYKEDLKQVDRVLSNPASLKYERERAHKARREIEGNRRELVGRATGWTTELHQAWLPKTPGAPGPPPPEQTTLDWVNEITMAGMLVVGVLLMLGFFTRLAALGAAGYLLMFYLSMPPWPGVPPPPLSEGHYLFVNKNLIELIACMVLATTPTGLWIGFDALFFGARARRKAALAEERSSSSDQSGGTYYEPPRPAHPSPARPGKRR